MLRLPDFELLQPREVAEAVDLLAERGDSAIPVGGGTDVYPKMKRRQLEPVAVVSLRGLTELQGFRESGEGSLEIGGGESLASVAAHPAIRSRRAALAESAASVGTPQIRTMGTIAGNLTVDTRCTYYDQSEEWRRAIGFCLKKDGDVCQLAPSGTRCWAIASSDTAPALIALGASVSLREAGGSRTLPLEDLYRDDGIEYLAKRPGEIVTSVSLPPADGVCSTYRKLRRRASFDFPILGVAVAVSLEDGIIRRARIALGAVASRPVRARAAEEMLAGARPSKDLARDAADAAASVAKPLDNTDLVARWRKRMCRVYVRRALQDLTGLPS